MKTKKAAMIKWMLKRKTRSRKRENNLLLVRKRKMITKTMGIR